VAIADVAIGGEIARVLTVGPGMGLPSDGYRRRGNRHLGRDVIADVAGRCDDELPEPGSLSAAASVLDRLTVDLQVAARSHVDLVAEFELGDAAGPYEVEGRLRLVLRRRGTV